MKNSSIISKTQKDCDSLILGRNLISLLDEACHHHPNNKALNQWQNGHWQSLSTLDFRQAVEEIALGLRELGLQMGGEKTKVKADRIALVMHNDIPFGLMDMGCLLAGFINVPIDLTQTIENIFFILQQTQAKVLAVSNLDLFYQLLPHFGEAPTLAKVILVEVPNNWSQTRTNMILRGGECISTIEKPFLETLDSCLHIPQLLCESHSDCSYPPQPFPQCISLLSLDELRTIGRKQWSTQRVKQLRDNIKPSDLATIIYIASETKQPKGVMLTHENVSANMLAAFSSYPNLKQGAQEVSLLFLPLTHIFARVFFYGHLHYGHSLYFSSPNHLMKDIQTVQPTIIITVPRLLEKIYERLLAKGQRLKKFDQTIFNWAFKLARRFKVNHPPRGFYRLQMQLAERLVFPQWRKIFGNSLKVLISGGAALEADLANFFSAANIPLVQGYGLTEASGVLCYNRGESNIPSTVGAPIAGVNFRIAEDGEILVKSPFIMQGYYQDAIATGKVIDADGWLKTGDLGTIDENGVLTITGVKKSLFKLSTGKYVSPIPLEEELVRSPLVDYAIIVGSNRKFCGMLIFANVNALKNLIQKWEIKVKEVDLLIHPRILGLYQTLIDAANCHLPYWSNVRKFLLLDSKMLQSIEADYHRLFTPEGKLNRLGVLESFVMEIDSLYDQNSSRLKLEHSLHITKAELISEFDSSPYSCPIYAQSLIHL